MPSPSKQQRNRGYVGSNEGQSHRGGRAPSRTTLLFIEAFTPLARLRRTARFFSVVESESFKASELQTISF
jgi:hypothetical protein